MGKMTKSEILDLYRTMLRMRRFDEETMRLFSKGEIIGSIHPCVGEEAVGAGVAKYVRNDDWFVSNHRGHGHAIAKGCEMKRMYAELYGRVDGYCRGKGGSMHIADMSHGLAGSNGIVGAGLPIATGLGLAAQIKKTDQVAVCFFGDGASNEGAFHESLNMAGVWHLPVVFVCENNGYAISVSKQKSTLVDDIAKRADGYGIPGVIVDGMDVLEVADAAKIAIDRARRGDGPTLIEAKTYRTLGHSRGDPNYGPYRSKEEYDSWMERDCLMTLTKKGNISEEEIQILEEEVKKEVQEGVEFAKNSPQPDLSEALMHVYAE